MPVDWSETRRLWDEGHALTFPDCRGEEADGVDLVLVDADLDGSVAHFLGGRFRDDAFQLGYLKQVAADLERIVPQLAPGPVTLYLTQRLRLARATLAALVEQDLLQQ